VSAVAAQLMVSPHRVTTFIGPWATGWAIVTSSELGQRAFASRGTDCAATVVANADTSSEQETIG